jgi:tripartite-type tricarboxylate transporter receptor subunit TctC
MRQLDKLGIMRDHAHTRSLEASMTLSAEATSAHSGIQSKSVLRERPMLAVGTSARHLRCVSWSWGCNMRNLLFAILLVAAFGSVKSATAQIYPSRPITMIVPFPAGGGTDVAARIVSEHMSRTLGQPIVIENIVGAGGTTGSTRAMHANPDGYTVEMGQMGTHATAVALYPNLAYKPDIDFAPIGLVNLNPVMIVARKDFPPRDFKEFIPYLKANAQKLNMAHAGVGSIGFSCGLLLNSILGVKPTMVPFNGSSPAENALIGGQVDYMCDGGANSSVPHVQSGAIKAYVFEAERRSPILPDVPTSKEAGLPEFQVLSWLALFAPKGTPKPILDKLTNALDKALDDQNVHKRFFDLIYEIPDKASRGQQPLATLVKREMARWTQIIKAANIKEE